MSAEQLFNMALQLSGYSTTDIFETANIGERLLSIVNTVYADIYYLSGKKDFVPLTDITQNLDLDAKALNDCAVFGVASLIQNILGTSDAYAVFKGIYDCKKLQLKKRCEIGQINDTFLKGSDC